MSLDDTEYEKRGRVVVRNNRFFPEILECDKWIPVPDSEEKGYATLGLAKPILDQYLDALAKPDKLQPAAVITYYRRVNYQRPAEAQ